MDIQQAIRQFQQAYDDALFSPLLKWNLKYKTKEFDGMAPYICINDICNYKYVVCAIPDAEVTKMRHEYGMLQELNRRKVIVEYNSIEEMVEAGWRLD